MANIAPSLLGRCAIIFSMDGIVSRRRASHQPHLFLFLFFYKRQAHDSHLLHSAAVPGQMQLSPTPYPR